MFILDIETLGIESTCVILSAGIVYFDDVEVNTPEKMLENSCFVKFNAQEQIESYNRTITQSTLDWWARQSQECRNISFVRRTTDETARRGMSELKFFMDTYDTSAKQIIWARGTLDQTAIDSLCRKMDVQPLTSFNNWRDIRTAVDILATEPVNGYCDTTKRFNSFKLIDHHPVHDCIRDALMLLYPK